MCHVFYIFLIMKEIEHIKAIITQKQELFSGFWGTTKTSIGKIVVGSRFFPHQRNNNMRL